MMKAYNNDDEASDSISSTPGASEDQVSFISDYITSPADLHIPTPKLRRYLFQKPPGVMKKEPVNFWCKCIMFSGVAGITTLLCILMIHLNSSNNDDSTLANFTTTMRP